MKLRIFIAGSGEIVYDDVKNVALVVRDGMPAEFDWTAPDGSLTRMVLGHATVIAEGMTAHKEGTR